MGNNLASALILASLCSFPPAAQAATDIKPGSGLADATLEALLNEVVAFKPAAGYHFNLKAPNDCDGGERVDATEKTVRCQFFASGSFSPRLYVCDDANALCVTERPVVKVSGKSGKPAGPGEALHPRDTQVSPNRGIRGFIHNDLAKARGQAQRENKPLLLFYTQLYCAPCRLMEETSLEPDEFQKLSSDLVRLQMDADLDSAASQLAQFGFKFTPALVLFDSGFRELDRMKSFASPRRIDDWVRRTLDRYGKGPVAAVLDKSTPTAAELERIGLWRWARHEYEEARKALEKVANRSPEAALCYDLAVLKEKKGEELVSGTEKLLDRIPECQHHSALWSFVPERGETLSPQELEGRTRVVDRALGLAKSGNTKDLDLDCRLDKAYLTQIKGLLYARAGDAERAKKHLEESADVFAGFQPLTLGGKGSSPKLFQAATLSEIGHPEGDRLYQELIDEDPADYSNTCRRPSSWIGSFTRKRSTPWTRPSPRPRATPGSSSVS
jgi:tetratricopeptide (TPR) repeat protein